MERRQVRCTYDDNIPCFSGKSKSENGLFEKRRIPGHNRAGKPALDTGRPGWYIKTDRWFVWRGCPTARNKYPEETIRKILDTAERLFIEKGYDRASLQDILDETGLSKGAVYHHFASKEDIFYAVCDRIGQRNGEVLSQVRDDPALNGLEKLRTMFKVSLQPERQAKMFCMMPYLMDNPRFLATEMRSIFTEVVPFFVEPIIRQGMADGSIQTEHPKELAEAMMMLSDVWINPIVQPSTPEEIRARCAVYNQLFSSFGAGGLIDGETIDILLHYAEITHPPSGGDTRS